MLLFAKVIDKEADQLTQLGSVLAAIALALTAYFGVAAWQATAEDRHDGSPVTMWEPSEALTQH